MPLTIAVFHCSAGVGSAWGCAEGISSTLSRFGYRVLDCGRPSYRRFSVSQLNETDLILLSAPEWYWDEFHRSILLDGLKETIPLVAWHAESAFRDDRDFDFRAIRNNVCKAFYPAIQDAEAFGGIWLPFGADHHVFHPRKTSKHHDCAFMGTMYAKRRSYIERIRYPLTVISPIDLENTRESFLGLSEIYCSIRIFINLPSLSRLIVTKVTEILACRTLVLTPRMDHPSARGNENQFEHGADLIYYNPERPEDVAPIIKWLLRNPEEIKRITENGARKVVDRYTLEHQLRTLIRETLGDSRELL